VTQPTPEDAYAQLRVDCLDARDERFVEVESDHNLNSH
jgi:hypothetical protein